MWFLADHTVVEAYERAFRLGLRPTEKQLAFHDEETCGRGGSAIMAVAGDTARITIEGVLTERPDWMASFLGFANTAYSQIIEAVQLAETDDAVANIEYFIASPGGMVDGLFDALAAIESATKPSRAVVGKAASAAYMLASQAGEIAAVNKASSFGSIGVKVTMCNNPDCVTITNTESPKKAPDPTTEAGRQDIQEELDATHQLFAEAIANGRGVTLDRVNAEFGQGAMFYADEALRRGMIDRVGGERNLTIVGGTQSASASKPVKKGATMDLETLKAEHPAVYAAAVEVGHGQGVEQERDRAGAFLTAGEQSGDMKTAMKAIRDGEKMTATLTTQFLMAAANRSDRQARVDDDAAAAAAADGSAEPVQGDAKTAALSNIFSQAAESLGCEYQAKEV